MRRIWRLIRFFVTMVAHAVRLRFSQRDVEQNVLPLFKADRQRKATYNLCTQLGVEIRMKGEIPKEGAMLAVSNHLGLLDPFLLSSQMPVAFAAKAEIAEWPIVGWVCKLVGVIFVKRERRMQTGMFVDQVQARIREGIRVLVFPEGTTSNGEEILPFKTGAFAAVANMEGGSILPFYMRGVTDDGQPAEGSYLDSFTWTNGKPMLHHAWDILGLRKMVFEIYVGEPIATTNRDRKELARLSYEAVSNLGRLSSNVDDKVDSNA